MIADGLKRPEKMISCENEAKNALKSKPNVEGLAVKMSASEWQMARL